MSAEQPKSKSSPHMKVFNHWRDLAEQIGDDYFRTGDPSMLFTIFQGCQNDPKYKKGMWKVYQHAEKKFKEKVALAFMREDLPSLIKGNDLLEWKYAYAIGAIDTWIEGEKKKDLVGRVNAKIAQSPRRKKLTKAEIEQVFANPRQSRNASTAAKKLNCDRKTLIERAGELGIKLPWKQKSRR